MQLQFGGRAVLDQKTGNLQVIGYVGGVPVQCVVERSAVTAGLNEACISDIETLEIFETRIREIESVASQRFFNGEHSPVVKRQHMPLR